MQRSRARSAALASGLAVLCASTALTAPSLALAQEPAAPPAAPPAEAAPPAAAAAPEAAPFANTGVVSRIIVQGNERIEQSTVLSYLPIQPGETVDPVKIDTALKALFRTDLFADVRIDFANGDLTVHVVENPIINRVIFEGNRGLKEDKLREEVSIRPRGIFTRARVQQDVQRIIELYRRSGRISAQVEPKVVELPQKRVDLIFEIDEGPKSGILRVNFLGNQEFSDNDLRDVVVTEQSAWYKFFSNNANYDPDRLEYDKEQLRKHYRNRGFYDFRVVSAVAELAPDKNGFVVTYTVDEGPEYKFGKVEVETELQRLNKEALTALLPIRTGQTYQDEAIEQATDSLTFAAGAAGFAFVDVRPRYSANPETQTVDVSFQVREGPRVYVDRIDIVGNTQTLDHVIRREMNVVEGDAYNRVLVDRSRNQIRALGFFKEVEIEELPGSAPDRTTLQVSVQEQPTGELSFSAGYSSVDQLVLDLGVTQRNFRGRGQDLRARL
ncbi:outer membrane protein assembly factor BamA, partial [Phenylobacterium sp.]|uniref:outer membrane protein assembly factor BamA n=1 Tax=Phenylobacterium sp. TaxID=1871053 RepID=UPI002E3520D5